MKRLRVKPRENYEERLTEVGFNYYNLKSDDDTDYWQESVMYGFSEREIDFIQESTQELHNMAIDMVSRIVKSGDYPEYFELNDIAKELIEQSWRNGDPCMYGRFDLAYNGKDLKMLEYNGDTPTSLLEGSVAQWDHIQEAPGIPDELRDQYNLIDETLVEGWARNFKNAQVHFAASNEAGFEDWGNTVYMMDAALRAGVKVKDISMQDIGLDNNGRFLDLDNVEMRNVFKLYPWEYMVKEQFAESLKTSTTRWIEPAWKMLLSNKAMLVDMWKYNPNHPLLLETYASNEGLTGRYAKKAIHGREGANVYQTMLAAGQKVYENLGQGSKVVDDYDKWGYVYQEWFELKDHAGNKPIIGSWVIDNKACGMSVREDTNLITGDNAHFASHIMVPYDLEDRYRHYFE